VLRQRSATLRELARSLERSLVTTLDRTVDATPSFTEARPRARLCEVLLARNLQQLHEMAEQLRDTAHRMQTRAAELELARTLGGAA
jgi:hypothetical protein